MLIKLTYSDTASELFMLDIAGNLYLIHRCFSFFSVWLSIRLNPAFSVTPVDAVQGPEESVSQYTVKILYFTVNTAVHCVNGDLVVKRYNNVNVDDGATTTDVQRQLGET